jgi:hypothetical protein
MWYIAGGIGWDTRVLRQVWRTISTSSNNRGPCKDRSIRTFVFTPKAQTLQMGLPERVERDDILALRPYVDHLHI